ncbi:MAG: isocitrate/isopropylmalate family dehydrogenase [Pseudomonadota bacterium]
MTISRDLALHSPRDFGARLPLAILPGEGIGPELLRACQPVLATIESTTTLRFDISTGGAIGRAALERYGSALTEEVTEFCRQSFAHSAPLLCGPGGHRFVYELRRVFDIYCKFVPIRPMPALSDTGVLRESAVNGVDVLVIRDNVGGLYQGVWRTESTPGGERAHQSFHYDEPTVRRLVKMAAAVSKLRRKRLCVVHKPGGAPAISELWSRIATEEVAGTDIDLRFLEVDTAAYLLIAEAQDFDVVVAPNMFGDVIGDAAALLLGSRGMSYSYNVGSGGVSVYQTAHGAAYDLAGTQRANPLGQIQSLATLLAESYGLDDVSSALMQACNAALLAGFRTPDISTRGCRIVSTQEMGERVADELARLLNARPDAAVSAG